LSEEGADKQVESKGAIWVKGKRLEACEDACQRHNLTCYATNDTWPYYQEEVFKIANSLGFECQIGVSAENTYDPFVVGPYCSFGPFKPPNVWGPWRPSNIRSCKAVPPSGANRLCSCVEEVPEKTCQECNGDCWKSDACCEPGYDSCAKDPLFDEKNPDYDYWGAGAAWEWGGVDPSVECMRGIPDAWGGLPKFWPAYTKKRDGSLTIKVLSYNLYWWNLFDLHHGRDGAVGHLIRDSGSKYPYDLMGFQECENLPWVLGDAGIEEEYGQMQRDHSICLAWRNSSFEKIEEGNATVGNDGGWVKNNKWGDRVVHWVRLLHRDTGDKVFFINHHGPLPLNSGGECGGFATAYSILSVIKASAEEGDIIVLVGDFNADYNSATIKMIAGELHLGYHGESFGGIDNMFSNTGEGGFVRMENLGGAGSDHDAITATIEIQPRPVRTTSTTTSVSSSVTSTSRDLVAEENGDAAGVDDEFEGDELEGNDSKFSASVAPVTAGSRQMEDTKKDGWFIWPFR